MYPGQLYYRLALAFEEERGRANENVNRDSEKRRIDTRVCRKIHVTFSVSLRILVLIVRRSMMKLKVKVTN